MAFVSNHLLKGNPLSLLKSVLPQVTKQTISDSIHSISKLTERSSRHHPNPIETLHSLDKVSNNCCKVIDSAVIVFKNFSDGDLPLQQELISAVDQINDFFGGQHLNHNRPLYNHLIQIACNPILVSLLDAEDYHLLQSVIKDLKVSQRFTNPSQLAQIQSIQMQIQKLNYQFMKNLNEAKPVVQLSKQELQTIPNRQFVKKYESLFSNDKEEKGIEFQNKVDLEMLKFSMLPGVRQKFLNAYSNSTQNNSQIIEQLCRLRQQLATELYSERDYFGKTLKQQTILFRGSLRQKIYHILQQIRPYTLKDIATIKSITGDPDIRYCDIGYLKEKLKAMLLARDPNNIQMLTCFSLKNVINGLLLLTSDIFKQKYIINTLVLNIQEGSFKKEEGLFVDEGLRGLQTDQALLFEIEIQGKGTIVMDLFDRASKQGSTSTCTFHEVGSSLLSNQQAVAYIVDSIPQDVQFLNMDQTRTLFHEFGHALNIALSQTKYQYYSCARGTLDLVEIPSHLCELFLKDYNFVKKFARAPGSDLPIQRSIFNKMIFCEQVFRFIDLEETLYFTALDIDFNSFKKGEDINEEKLLQINRANLTTSFSANVKQQKPLFHLSSSKLSDTELEAIISDTVSNDEGPNACLEKVQQLLFGEGEADYPFNLEDKLDQEKVKDFEQNYLFTRFHHLFEYDATYYSYLLAKISSAQLYQKHFDPIGKELPKPMEDLFSQGGFFKYKGF